MQHKTFGYDAINKIGKYATDYTLPVITNNYDALMLHSASVEKIPYSPINSDKKAYFWMLGLEGKNTCHDGNKFLTINSPKYNYYYNQLYKELQTTKGFNSITTITNKMVIDKMSKE